MSRGDGVDWAFIINTRDWPPAPAPTLDDLSGLTGVASPNSITHVLDVTPL